jgi:hypothetical protein
MLDENDAESIKKCKQFLKSNNLEANLAFIIMDLFLQLSLVLKPKTLHSLNPLK